MSGLRCTFPPIWTTHAKPLSFSVSPFCFLQLKRFLTNLKFWSLLLPLATNSIGLQWFHPTNWVENLQQVRKVDAEWWIFFNTVSCAWWYLSVIGLKSLTFDSVQLVVAFPTWWTVSGPSNVDLIWRRWSCCFISASSPVLIFVMPWQIKHFVAADVDVRGGKTDTCGEATAY